ncbi:hypothetical protein [Salinigranum halophilum]|jgi:hypothetical protein|uniref:hypothetical protein n=1 Tax=Salinigranum halophilum TaxID=2565931 RepID=UPI0010A83A20|nr:hypothetical protein [Salinigranum halophilum]
MSRTFSHSGSSSDPVPALALLLVGITSLVLAVLYPIQQLAAQASVMGMVSGSTLVVPVSTLVVAAGLLVVSASATTLGLLVLFLRL